MDFRLDGKVAVVTGVASGIGAATAELFAEAGAIVVGGDIDEAGGLGVVEKLRSQDSKALFHWVDVAQRGSVDELFAAAMAEFGQINTVANIAGVMSRALVADIDDAELDRIWGINFQGVLYGCQAAVAAMARSGGGTIVNVSSGAIDGQAPGIGAYAVTKAGVAMLTKVLATEVGGAGIRVNCVAPGLIETSLSRPHFAREDGSIDPARSDSFRAQGKMWPVGRVGTAADVAGAILYLASEVSSFTTGQILRPNGGMAMPW